MVVGIVLQVFQGQILQFRFELVETQLVGEWGIEEGSFPAHLLTCLIVLRLSNLPHQVHTSSNHDEHHPHVLGKGKQQVTEVLALDGRVLGIEVVDTD